MGDAAEIIAPAARNCLQMLWMFCKKNAQGNADKEQTDGQ
jgi:hypothetical protein